MLGKIIRALYYILFFTVPLIVIPTTSELFELNKMVVIYFVALLVFCFGALDATLQNKPVFKRTPFDIPLAVFMGVLLLSWLFSIDRHTSFFGYYGRFNGGILSMLAFVVLYHGASWYFRMRDVINLIRVSVVSSVLVIIWGLSGKLGFDFSCMLFTGQLNNSCWTDQFKPAERMFSTLGQPNWLGAYLAAQFFLGAYLYIAQQKKEQVSSWYASIPYGIYLVINFMCLLFTRSRSAFIAWGVGAVIFAAYFIVTKRRDALRPFISVGIVCLVAILLFKTGVERIDRFMSLPGRLAKPSPVIIAKGESRRPSDVTESFDIRKIVWSGAWELGKKYPFLGTGPETFAYSYYSVRPQEHNMTSEWDYIYNKAHNEYLNYLATTGFTGLAAYVFLVGSVIWYLVKKIKSVRLGTKTPVKNSELAGLAFFYLCLLCSFITVLITNFFGFSTSTSQLVLYIVPALAVAAGRAATTSAPRLRSFKFWHYVQMAGLGIAGTISLIWLIVFFAADLQYSQGVARLSQGEYQRAASNFSDALTLHYEHVYEDRLSTSLAGIALLSAYGETPDKSGKFVTLARYYIDHAIEQSPKNMLYWKTKGKNEYTFYQANPDEAYLEEAIKALVRAYELAPTEPKMPYTLGLLHGATNNKETSIQFLDKTIALKNDYLDAYVLKLKLLRAWKEDEKANVFESQILSVFPSLTKEALQEELK